MTLSDYLGVLGVVVSAVFGAWGVYLVLRRAKYPGSITFVRDQLVSLLEDVAHRIPNLAVRYKDTTVDSAVVLVSGYIVNDGSLDITTAMTEQPLRVALPGDCSWLEFNITTTAPSLKVEAVIVEKGETEFRFGLFRRDESFSFQALALLDQERAKKRARTLASDLKWSHRIAGLGSIKTLNMPDQPKRKRWVENFRRGMFLSFFGFYAFYGSSQLLGVGPIGTTPAILHDMTDGAKESTVLLSPKRDGTTVIRYLDSGTREEVDLNVRGKTATFRPKWSQKPYEFWPSGGTGLFLLISSLMFLHMGFAPDYRRYRVKKLVAASAKET